MMISRFFRDGDVPNPADEVLARAPGAIFERPTPVDDSGQRYDLPLGC
jgi:hypothetical protein